MKAIRWLSACFTLSIALFLTSHVYAVDLDDLSGAAGTVQKGAQVLQAGEAATTAVPATTSGTGLIGLLMQQLGVTQPQAEGGAGTLFQHAKSRMSAGDFTTLSNSVPDMQGLLAAAPAPVSAPAPAAAGAGAVGGGGMMGDLAGMAAGNLPGMPAGNLPGMAGSFQQLGLAPDMVQKFIPIVVQYVQGTGGSSVASALQSALMGGM
ncbi:DUF2780 domain-containing protein [Nitrosomonas sp. Nm58]|uniref:DUF2780 domain-containing protein n=1 Tax=Nitrosomonas sp. Nm58 TaxID=200126 RepID=UPI0008987FDB|nr:DUF2780 domain-containing protein [Nitrosomonas sp. Nm58]SDY20205.1 Protein of unknown function VcgC/VcgE [Nitrosomonas sp. Nm58]